ncbi:hypothetical protein NDN08_007000 [Rhodosorus marinus]|uniref:Probable ATP-dependent transporter ycf16 n=1 Tax=Rhodosorus marinus TaxID=101924 RepID=A0AAV8UJB3_9RHOD|nr:hypothetical protein NDN08_007000 [Rhodosorus marinus]
MTLTSGPSSTCMNARRYGSDQWSETGFNLWLGASQISFIPFSMLADFRRSIKPQINRQPSWVARSTGNSQAGSPSTGTKLVQLQKVTYAFGSTVVISDLDLDLVEGEIVCLLGPSGSGKSTILRIIAGLAKPTSGRVLYRGRAFEGVNPGTAIVFQTFALYPWLTVLENVGLGIQAGPSRRSIALKAIDTIGLDGYIDAYPRELSGGMRQRVGFARALAVQPEVLCMDEPFSALDVLTAENLRSELLRLWQGGEIPTRSIFVVTHGIEEAVSIADRVIVLQRDPGRVQAILPIAIPHPRDKRSPEFQTLVDRVYTVISRPEEDADELLQTSDASSEMSQVPLTVMDTKISVDSDAQSQTETKRKPMLPAVRIGSVAGLLNFIDEDGTDIYRLGQSLQLDVDEIYPIIEAADLIGLVDVQEGDVLVNDRGAEFVKSSINQRKALVRESVLKEEGSWLIPQIYHLLGQSRRSNRIPQELIFDMVLLKHFTPQEARKQLEIAIEWGRYAELFTYDALSGELFLVEGEDIIAQEELERPDLLRHRLQVTKTESEDFPERSAET